MSAIGLSSIIIENFKAIEHANVSIASLTLLVGPNNAGKSSFLHALACLWQSLDGPGFLHPRGKFVDVGGIEDFVHDASKPIKIAISGDSQFGCWCQAYVFSLTNDGAQYYHGLPFLDRLGMLDEGSEEVFKLQFERLAQLKSEKNESQQHRDAKVGAKPQLFPVFRDQKSKGRRRYRLESLSTWKPYPESTIKQDVPWGVPSDWFEYAPPIRAASPCVDLVYPDRHVGIEGRCLKEWLLQGPSTQTLSQSLDALLGLAAAGPEVSPPPDRKGKSSDSRRDRVCQWLSYVLGEELRLLSRSVHARPGEYEWSVERVGQRGGRRLVNCGIGLSQLIPLLVCQLYASSLELLVLEQPELHLHPDAQLRLGDYLLELSRHTTVIAETHSEHIINRVRRRVAEDGTHKENVKLVFCNMTDTGKAQYKTVGVDEYGALDGPWPPGFCDQVPDEAEAILRAREKTHDQRGDKVGL